MTPKRHFEINWPLIMSQTKCYSKKTYLIVKMSSLGEIPFACLKFHVKTCHLFDLLILTDYHRVPYILRDLIIMLPEKREKMKWNKNFKRLQNQIFFDIIKRLFFLWLKSNYLIYRISANSFRGNYSRKYGM